MKSAIVRFFSVTAGILILLGFGWVYLSSKGAQKTYAPHHHPFWRTSESFVWISYLGDQDKGPPSSWAAYDSAASQGADIVLWADVRLTPQGQPVLTRDEQSPSLREFVERYPGTRLILNILDYGPGTDQALVQIVRDTQSAERILLQSPRDGPLKEIRKLEPLWLFGTSQAQITQMLTLTSMNLQSLAGMHGDVYISPFRFTQSEIVTPEIAAEVHRRHKKLLVGPVSSHEDLQRLQSLNVDGVITPWLSRLRTSSSY